MRGVRDWRIDAAIISPCVAYLWEAFMVMHVRRRPGFSGHVPLSSAEVCEHASARGFEWSAWEVDTLLAVDLAVLSKLAAQKE